MGKILLGAPHLNGSSSALSGMRNQKKKLWRNSHLYMSSNYKKNLFHLHVCIS